MVPGMGQCAGGVGPKPFDALEALDSWEVKGTAPEKMIASKVVMEVAEPQKGKLRRTAFPMQPHAPLPVRTSHVKVAASSVLPVPFQRATCGYGHSGRVRSITLLTFLVSQHHLDLW